MLHHLAGATIQVVIFLKRMAITQEPVIEHVLRLEKIHTFRLLLQNVPFLKHFRNSSSMNPNCLALIHLQNVSADDKMLADEENGNYSIFVRKRQHEVSLVT